MTRKVFLSCVTREFAAYREKLAKDLRLPGVEVRVQEDFVERGHTTLEKLDEYIRACDEVVHIVGLATGSPAQPTEVANLLKKYPDIPQRLPFLGTPLESAQVSISYTQWEAWLAIYHGRPCYVYRAEASAPRPVDFVPDLAQEKAQNEHWRRLEEMGKDRRTFEGEQQLCRLVLRSLYLPPELGREAFGDRTLLQRLPLPLAQVCRRALNATSPRERHVTAYLLWEASLRLMGAVTAARFADEVAAGRLVPDSETVTRLTTLVRPGLEDWWDLVRRLAPILADTGDTGFRALGAALLGTRDDLPAAARLDTALRATLDGEEGASVTVSVADLFSRLIAYRKRELTRAAEGRRSPAFQDRMAQALLAGVCEILDRVNVLAGYRLLYVHAVDPQPSGEWLIGRSELIGEESRPIESAVLSAPGPKKTSEDSETSEVVANKPQKDRVYLSSNRRSADLCDLYPLVIYDAEEMEIRFFSARHGPDRLYYVGYRTGRFLFERPNAANALREFLARALGKPVREEDVQEWETQLPARDPDDDPALHASTKNLGEFELLSELGKGGMGIVYRAWQPSLGRQVAVKKLLTVGDARVETRFAREITALARVEHPNLVKIFTSGSAGDEWYYAMELLEGTPLSAVSDKLETVVPDGTQVDLPRWQQTVVEASEKARQAERPVGNTEPWNKTAPAQSRPWQNAGRAPAGVVPFLKRTYVDQAAELLCQAAEAAHALHEAGIIHRDIKPGNIMVTEGGAQAVLIDLGLARLAEEIDRGVTRTRQFVGTLRYASPEQLAGARLDRRADVYSLGATLWELLALKPLFGVTGDTATPDLILQIQQAMPERLSKYRPNISRDLQAIVDKCLEKEPAKRYGSARELALDLRRFLNGVPVQARSIGRLERGWRWCKRNPVVSLLATALVLALVGGLLTVTWKWREAEGLRRDAQATTVKILRDRGLNLTQEGDIGRGLLFLARALSLAQTMADDTLDRTIRVDLGDWRNQVHSLKLVLNQDGPITVAAVSRDGRLAVSAGPETPSRVWNLATGQPAGPALVFPAEVAAAAFGADGSTVLLGYKGQVGVNNDQDKQVARLWDVASGRMLKELAHEGDLLAVAVSPDGQILLTGSIDRKARLWNAATGQLIGAPLEHGNGVYFVSFSPDGTLALTASKDRTARLLETSTGKQRGAPMAHAAEVTGATFVADAKKVLTSTRDGLLHLWDATSASKLRESQIQLGEVQALAVSPNGAIAAALDGDDRVSFWTTDTLKALGTLVLDKGNATGLAFSPDGKTLVTRGQESEAQLWDVATRRPIGQPLSHQRLVATLAFVPDTQQVLTASWDGTARLWEMSPGDRPLRILPHPRRVLAVAFSPDGRLVATAGEGIPPPNAISSGEVRLWSAAEGNRLVTLPHDHTVGALAFDASGSLLVTGCDDGLARLWRIPDGKLTGETFRPADGQDHQPIRAVAFSPDGTRIATGGFGGATTIWDKATGQRIGKPLSQDGLVCAAAFSPDGTILATGGADRKVRFWNATTGETTGNTLPHQDEVLALAFNPDGKWLATASRDGVATLWDVATGKSLGTPLRPKGGNALRGVTFSPDGVRFATAGADQKVRFSLVPTGRPVGPELLHDAPINGVAWSPAGDLLLTGCEDGASHLWRVAQPVSGSATEETLKVEVMTGLELDADETPRVLNAAAWRSRQERLQKHLSAR